MDKVKIGLLGAGAWGRNLARNFATLPGCELAAVSDAEPKRAGVVAELAPGARFSPRADEIFNDSSIQAVVISTPPATHYELGKKALQAGKDLFVEKPLVLDVAQGEELVRLAEEQKRILMVGHIMVYHPATLKLKDYIRRGEFGEVYYLYASRVNLGKVRDIENALWSFAPHDISMVLFFLEKLPVQVTATGRAYLQPGIEDVCFLTMHFDTGQMAHIHVSWLDPHKDRKVTIVGSKKMAVFDDSASSEKIWIYDKGVNTNPDYTTYGEYLALRTGDILIPKVESKEPLSLECQHFIDCVRERKSPRSDGRSGLDVLKVLEAAQRSLKAGGTPQRLAT
ncbi:MAG: Gfo/Idh/MocA family oxidoreductase [candidate division Zixibacteria bacterium]|nr:Gfo/Idh/MocA family oxidoreductase [candidate division Zixibacteria bacterium]